MTLEPLLPLFHRLDRQHFEGSLSPGGQALVQLRWSDRRMVRTAGLYRHGRRRDGSRLSEIVLSRPLLEPLPRAATLSTLCHEMIHAWIDRVLERHEVHGPLFRARMAAINATQSEFLVSLRHSYPLPVANLAWIASCPPLRPGDALSPATPGVGLPQLLPTLSWWPLGSQLSAGV